MCIYVYICNTYVFIFPGKYCIFIFQRLEKISVFLRQKEKNKKIEGAK